MHTDALTGWLADNPRMIGVLFAMLVALNGAGSAAASSGCAMLGP